MNKRWLIIGILIFLSGCANLDTYLQENNYQKAKEEALYMENDKINEKLDNGSTYLIETIKYNKPKLESILIKRKADIYKTDKKGFSPLYYAIKSKNIKLINPIFKKIFKNKKENYIKKEIQKYPTLKPLFLKELPKLIDVNSSYSKIILLSNLFSNQEQTQIFSKIKNKKKLLNIISNQNNKFLTFILNYSIKTKNYDILNALSTKNFIYDMNYSLPNINAIQYVNKVEKYGDRSVGFITNLVYASNINDSFFKNFSNALNIGVKKYISPNKILIGKYHIPTLKSNLFINDYRKTKKYFVFGLYVKPYQNFWGREQDSIDLSDLIINNEEEGIIIKFENNNGKTIYLSKKRYIKLAKKLHLKKDVAMITKDGITYYKLGNVRTIINNAKIYYPKTVSVAQNLDFRSDNTSEVPLKMKIDLAASIFIPHFKINLKKGKFESTSQFKKRLAKLNKNNEKKLNKFIITLNKRIKDYKNSKKLFNEKNIKKVTEKIKNIALSSVATSNSFDYKYNPDKEIYKINIKMSIPVNITKTFNVNYPSVDKNIILTKIQCLGSYGNPLKLTFEINSYKIYLAKFSKWFSFSKDYKIRNENYITYIHPYIYNTKFNLSDIFYNTPNGAIKNIKNPCLKLKTFTLKIPVKRKFAPAVDKLLSKKDFTPTLIFKVKNNQLKLTGIEELEYPNEIYQHEELMKVYNNINGIKKWINKYPHIKLTKLAKQRLEELKFKKAIQENTFRSLNRFKKIYPHSKYIKDINKAIYKLKQNKAMKYITHNWVETKWDNIRWDGNWGKDGWPTGKGKFLLFKAVANKDAFLGLGKVFAVVNVKAYIKNHKLINGKISAYLKQTKLLTTSYTNTYSDSFQGIEDMNNKIIKLINMAIEEWNGNKIKAHHSPCTKIFNSCMNYCKSKSSKGFFNDKDSCIESCYSGRNACKNGKHSWGLRLSCAGICKGAKEGNGGFLWDSDYDKCIDKCIYKLK